MSANYAVTRENAIPVIEDTAHALGTQYQGKPVGCDADFSCFSFYAIKNFTTIKDSAIACRDAETAKHLRRLAANGMDANTWER